MTGMRAIVGTTFFGVLAVACVDDGVGAPCASTMDCYAGQECQADGQCVAARSIETGREPLAGRVPDPAAPIVGEPTSEVPAVRGPRFVGDIGRTHIDGGIVVTAFEMGGVHTIYFTAQNEPNTFFFLNAEESLLETAGEHTLTAFDAGGNLAVSFGQACNYSGGEGYDEVIPEVVVTVDPTDESGVFDVDVVVDGEGTDAVAGFTWDSTLL